MVYTTKKLGLAGLVLGSLLSCSEGQAEIPRTITPYHPGNPIHPANPLNPIWNRNKDSKAYENLDTKEKITMLCTMLGILFASLGASYVLSKYQDWSSNIENKNKPYQYS